MFGQAAGKAFKASKRWLGVTIGTRSLATEVPRVAASDAASSSAVPAVRKRRERLLAPGVTEKEFSSKILNGRSVLSPIQHPKTHGIPVASIHIRGHDHRALELFSHFASHAAAALGVPFSTARLPTQRSLWTVPKGPFVHKKNQENFERKVHKRVMTAWDATDNVIETLLSYMAQYPQPGIGLRIVRWRRAPLGMGRRAEQERGTKAMEAMKLDNVTDKQKVEQLARDIVEAEMRVMGKEKLVVAKKSPEATPS